MISKEIVEKIRKLYLDENKSQPEIANLLNMKPDNVRYIIKRNKFKKSQELQNQVRERVLIEKYGTAVPLKNHNSVQNLKNTCIEKYGVDNPTKNKEIQEKIKKTNLEKYGVEYIPQTKQYKQKITETSLKKYGVKHFTQSSKYKLSKLNSLKNKYDVDNVMHLDFVKAKLANTNLKKYGSISPFGNKEIQEKIKQTNLEKYGVEYTLSSKDIQDKIAQTNLEKYGSTSPFGNKEVQEKSKQTNLKKYNVEYAINNQGVKAKKDQTNLEKYGSTSPFSSKEIQEKAQQTNLEKYGTTHALRSDVIRKKILETNIKRNCPNYYLLRDKKQFYKAILEVPEEERTTYKCAEKIGVNLSTFCKFLNLHNLIDKVNIKKRRSHFEDEIIDWIKTFYTGQIISNYREFKKYEIDIYLPDIKLGIEFNGTYWHSVELKGSKYHYNKTQYFKKLDIQICHIYEYEWIDSFYKDKLKSYLKSLILKNNIQIYARKCILKDLSNDNNDNVKIFLNTNHLQGTIGAQIKLGLFYNNKLVQLMTFSTPRYNKKCEWELLRLCSKNRLYHNWRSRKII